MLKRAMRAPVTVSGGTGRKQ